MTAPPELPRPPEPLMTVHIASAPGRKTRPVTIDAATCTRLLRDVGIAAKGIRQAQATIDAITGPAGRHAAGILRELAADDDAWGALITPWQARRDQPSCPSAWTPDGGPTFACTLVPGHEATHQSWPHGATFPQAAWTDADADQRGDHPYPEDAVCMMAGCGHAGYMHWEVAEPEGAQKGCSRIGCTCAAYLAAAALPDTDGDMGDAAVEAVIASAPGNGEPCACGHRYGAHLHGHGGCLRVGCRCRKYRIAAGDDAAGPRHDPAAERAAGDDPAADALVRADERATR